MGLKGDHNSRYRSRCLAKVHRALWSATCSRWTGIRNIASHQNSETCLLSALLQQITQISLHGRGRGRQCRSTKSLSCDRSCRRGILLHGQLQPKEEPYWKVVWRVYLTLDLKQTVSAIKLACKIADIRDVLDLVKSSSILAKWQAHTTRRCGSGTRQYAASWFVVRSCSVSWGMAKGVTAVIDFLPLWNRVQHPVPRMQ